MEYTEEVLKDIKQAINEWVDEQLVCTFGRCAFFILTH